MYVLVYGRDPFLYEVINRIARDGGETREFFTPAAVPEDGGLALLGERFHIVLAVVLYRFHIKLQ